MLILIFHQFNFRAYEIKENLAITRVHWFHGNFNSATLKALLMSLIHLVLDLPTPRFLKSFTSWLT